MNELHIEQLHKHTGKFLDHFALLLEKASVEDMPNLATTLGRLYEIKALLEEHSNHRIDHDRMMRAVVDKIKEQGGDPRDYGLE